MVTIELYRNYSEPLKVNKELEWIKTLSGTFRSGTSITNPIIEIESSEYINIDFDVVTSDNNEVVTSSGDELSIISDSNKIVNINYIYIKEFNRYYYVTDVVCLLNKLYQFNCSIDHLYTYKDKYLDKDALVERNEFTYYDGIEDNKMPYEFYQDVNEYIVTDTSYINFKNKTGGSKSIAISYINKVKSNTGNIASVLAPSGVFPYSLLYQPDNDSLGSNTYNKYCLTDKNQLKNLINEIYNNESQLSFLTSVVAFPFDITYPSSLIESSLVLGDEEYSNVKIYGLASKYDFISPYYFVASIDFNNYFTGSYMDYEPYTKYELYLPFYDYVELKSADIKNSIVDVYYTFDFTNGNGKIFIINRTKNYIIKSVECNIGVKIAVNRNNLQQLQDERIQLGIKSAISGVSSVASIIGGSVIGNPLLVASGVVGLTNTGIDIATKLALQHEKSSSSNNSSYNECYGTRDIRLKITKYVKREPDNYTHYYGKPLNANVKLIDLSGYTLIKDIYLDDISATKNEIDALYSLLTNGIIL